MAGQEHRRHSVFERLGEPLEDGDSRRIMETTGGPTLRGRDTKRSGRASAPHQSGRSERRPEITGKRHCWEADRDDRQPAWGSAFRKRPRLGTRNERFGEVRQPDHDRCASPSRAGKQEAKTAEQAREQTRRDLRQLTSLDTGKKVATWLAGRPDCLKTVVGMEEMSEDDMEKLLRVLARACTEGTYFQSTLKIVLDAVADSQFFTRHLPEWIMKMRFSDKIEAMADDVCTICSSICELLPRQASYVASVLSQLYANCHSQMMQTECTSGEGMLDKVRRLNDDCKAILVETQDQQKCQALNKFRKMSVIPDLDEVCFDVKQSLNPNLKHGAYDSVDSYLDTQFRLLREDFVAPLRLGICSIIKQQQGRRARKRADDVRVYLNVRVLQPVCGHDGISHSVQFDISGLTPGRLASQKILRYGSLVCLSADEFRTINVAVVTGRDHISRGIVDVMFQETVAESGVYGFQSFIMVESNAFFEAYRPVLKGLQKITGETLPHQRYIVEASCRVLEPQYLLEAPQANYDLMSLFRPDCAFQALYRRARMRAQQICIEPTPERTSQETSSLDDSTSLGSATSARPWVAGTGKGNTASGELAGISSPHKTEASGDSCPSNPIQIPVGRFEQWPGAGVTCLDESQRRAVHAALTQEVAVIQGPPGTGKTYVGLKIMEVLLNKRNRAVWSGGKTTRPILVVCYTNHALDQFLEGMLDFEKDIVRVGSRSKSETLEKYNLKHVKQAKLRAMMTTAEHLDVPKEKRKLFESRDDYKQLIEDKVKEASACTEAVMGLGQLRRFMTPQHIRSVASRTKKGVATVSNWLELLPFLETISRCRRFPEPFCDLQEDARHDSLDTQDERMLDDELDDTPTFRREAVMGVGAKHTDAEFVLQGCKVAVESEHDGPDKQKKLTHLQIIEQQLRNPDRMRQDEADEIQHVWELHIVDKWRLYRHWVGAYRTECLEATSEATKKYDSFALAIKEIENDEARRILMDTKVIGMTTTAAARWQPVLQQVGPRIVVVEEAAEVMEAHVITTLSQHCQHLILIGDHQQLRPNPAVYRLAKHYNLDLSLFERLINNSFPLQSLVYQHRMRPEISEIMRNHFYRDLQDDDSVLGREDVRGTTKNVFFINHGFSEDSCDDWMKSHSSRHEAEMTVALSRYLLQQGYSASQVTILTVYTGQLLSIKSLLRDDPLLGGVRVSVVDNYQGEESDIVLLSLVRSNEEGAIGFLATPNRICVMLSRAKLGLFCIGNFDQLAAKSDKWKAIANEMREKQLLGDSLVLACSEHPGEETKVARAADFQQVPDGGCKRPCEFRLLCGHVCTRLCHPDDRSHERFVCLKPCERAICGAKHKCPNPCGEACVRVCERNVVKQLPGCGHSAKMKCYNNPSFVDCSEKCEKQLPCGHTCRGRCGVPCADRRCTEKVRRSDLPCGHREEMPCSDGDDQCPALCGKLLACGHNCQGKCSACLGGRLHVSCRLRCGRILVCGHKCRSQCAGDCPPCQARCENRCMHSKCEKRCWEPCAPCQEPCQWSCRHHRCGKKCGEPCDRPPCDRPCKKQLPECGHPCIGMCGEPCPSRCRVCHAAEVTEIFFGTEDEDGAAFVELRDCRHAFEVSGLDQWMRQAVDAIGGLDPEVADGSDAGGPADPEEPPSVSIQLKSCPRCKTPIRRSTRYGSIINRALADIERVKRQVTGDPGPNARIKGEVKSMLSEVKESRPFSAKNVDTVAKCLCSGSPSPHDLNLLYNETKFAMEVVRLDRRLRETVIESLLYIETIRNTNHVACRLFNPSRPFRGTDQELLDFPGEFRRLHLCIDACEVADLLGPPESGSSSSSSSEKPREQLARATRLLGSGKRLTAESELETGDNLREARKSLGGLAVSERTKVMIVKAMGLPRGHWYKCPNGHVYAIGECGGAMQRGQCPECQASIGGSSHRLAGGNSVASEMDGAKYAAWSEQANLAIYNLLDELD